MKPTEFHGGKFADKLTSQRVGLTLFGKTIVVVRQKVLTLLGKASQKVSNNKRECLANSDI